MTAAMAADLGAATAVGVALAASLESDEGGGNAAQVLYAQLLSTPQQTQPGRHGPQGPPGLGGHGPHGPPGATGPPGVHVPVMW